MKRTIIIVVLLALLIPGVLAAQDEITLESLAETVTALTERVDTLESVLIGPGAIELADGACQIAGDGGIQNETVIEWQTQRGEWPNVDQMRVASVVLNEDGTMTVAYVFSFTQEHIEEIWQDCEFVSTGDWYEIDWEGNRIEEE